MRLGIDIDDVVYDFDQAARSVLLEFDQNPQGSKLPEPLTEGQRLALINGVNHDRWDGILQIVGSKNWSCVWETANYTNLFSRGLPLPGALDALAELSYDHEIWLMTARGQQWSHQTYRWLDRFDVNAAGVVHGKTKWKVAADLDFRVVVDDGPENLRGYLLRTKGSMRGAYIYGIKRYEPVKSSYYRFRYVNSLVDVVAEQGRWTA